MKATKFEIRTRTSETRVTRSIDMICPGCTSDFASVNQDSALIAAYDDLASAKAALAKRESSIRFFQSAGMQYVSVSEYWIEQNIYDIDEDGDAEWIDGGDIIDFSAMPEEIEWRANAYRWDATASRYQIDDIKED